jgi:hypothetical protein
MPLTKHFPQFSSAQVASIPAGTAATTLAGVTGQTIRALYIFFTASVAGTVTFGHGAGPTAYSGAMTVATGVLYKLDLHDCPLITLSGEAFVITPASSANIAGFVMYEQGQD